MLRRERGTSRSARPGLELGRGLGHVIVLGALAVSAGGYVELLSGQWWWISTVGITAAVLGLTALIRRIGARGAPVAGLVVAFVLVAVACVPGTMVLGIVPTPSTFTGMLELLDRAGTLVAEEAPPVEATAPITLIVTGAFALVALACDLLLQRRGGVTVIGLLLAAIYLVPAAVADEVPSFVVLAVPATLWLLLLHRSTRRAGTDRFVSSAGVVVGVGAVVLAFALAPVLPDTSALTGTADDFDGGPFGNGINPILTLGDDLRRPDRATALEYTTEGAPPYLSVAMLRDFTGETWEPVTGGSSTVPEGRVDLAEGIATDREVVDIEIRSLRTRLLPVPYPAVDVRGLDGDWGPNGGGLTYASESSDTRNQTYSVTSIVRQPTAEQLALASEDVPPRVEPYLELPDDVPTSITETAQRVAGAQVGAYAKAQALQDFFRSGEFVYSETAPVEGDYDGNGIEVLETFLEQRSGYCVHYSSAMAVMARSLGVPSRIMVGYAPGTRIQPNPDTPEGSERYRVTTDQLHAWTQVYVDGVGWVGFEPTPGIADGDDAPQPDSAPSVAVPTASAAVPEPTQAAPTPSAQADPTIAAETTTVRTTDVSRTALLLVAIVAGAAVLPGSARAGLRRWRLRRASTPDDWWREIVDTADDVGVATDTATTLGAHADELARHVGTSAQEALGRLRSLLEAQRYGPRRVAVREHEASRDDALRVVADLLGRATPAKRRRARVAPRSLWRRD